MRIFAVVADATRPGSPGNVSLLNAAWSFTTATPLVAPDEGWTLPPLGLVVFVEADWHELNKPHNVRIELLTDDAERVEFSSQGNVQPATITSSITVPSTPGAPNGTPGRGHVLVEIGGGALRVKSAPGRLIWHISVGAETAETGFWVNVPPPQPRIGASEPSP